jgi:hypothetical protein
MNFFVCLSSEGDAHALQERGRQVALMDEIYGKATQVNVHLGSGDGKSDEAIRAVKSLAIAFSSVIMAKRSGVGQEAARQGYEQVADEVLGESCVYIFYLLFILLLWVNLLSVQSDIFRVLGAQAHERLCPEPPYPVHNGLLWRTC